MTGCSAASKFRDETRIEMGLVQDGVDKTWLIFISNPAWTRWIEKKSKHPLRIQTTKRWRGEFSVTELNSLWMDVSVGFMNSIADANLLKILNDNDTLMASLNMKDAAGAIRAVVNCVKEHPYKRPPEEAITVSRNWVLRRAEPLSDR